MAPDRIKQDIARIMRRLYRQKLTTTSGGNISMRDGEKVYITPSGLDKGIITGNQIGVMDLEGNRLDGNFKPSIESGMHLEIYRRRPDIAAIVHAHPPAACSFAVSGIRLNTRMASESYAILGDVAMADYALMGSAELAGITAAAAAAANCVLMRNHGALALGKSLLEAFDRLEVLENAALININLRLLGADRISGLDAGQLAEIDRLAGRSQ